MAKRISTREAKYFENLMSLHPAAIALAGTCRLHRSMLVVLNDAVNAFVEGNGRIRAQQGKLLDSLRLAAEEADQNVQSFVEESDRVAAELKIARDAIDRSGLDEAVAEYIAAEDRIASQVAEARELVFSRLSFSKVMAQCADALENAEDRRNEQCKSLLVDQFQEFVDEASLSSSLSDVEECLDRIDVES